MTSRFGWPVDAESANRETLNWALSRDKREAQDRPIEAALRPRMINQFVAKLSALPKEIRDEFDGISTAIKTYQTLM